MALAPYIVQWHEGNDKGHVVLRQQPDEVQRTMPSEPTTGIKDF
jgi:hypothetical protein